MLKQRVLTGIALALLAIVAVVGLPSPLFALIMAVVFLLSGWEWSSLARLEGPFRWGFATALAAIMTALYLYIATVDALMPLLWVALIGWLLAAVQVAGYPAGSQIWRNSRPMSALAGLLVLIPSWIALVAIHRWVDPMHVIMVMLLVSFADIGGYFAGRRFGRHKLAPRLSPGKTWEGVMGALSTTLLLAVLGHLLLPSAPPLLPFLLLSVASVIASIIGDLFESLFKRLAGMKDSGSLLPGHGGLLDRIDGLTAAAPIYALGLVWALP